MGSKRKQWDIFLGHFILAQNYALKENGVVKRAKKLSPAWGSLF